MLRSFVGRGKRTAEQTGIRAAQPRVVAIVQLTRSLFIDLLIYYLGEVYLFEADNICFQNINRFDRLGSPI